MALPKSLSQANFALVGGQNPTIAKKGTEILADGYPSAFYAFFRNCFTGLLLDREMVFWQKLKLCADDFCLIIEHGNRFGRTLREVLYEGLFTQTLGIYAD